jgi:hypothetical protein
MSVAFVEKDTRTLDAVATQRKAEGLTPRPQTEAEQIEEVSRESARAFIAAHIINAKNLFDTEPPPRDPVVENVFDMGSLVAIIAPSKCRKSFFALQLAACIASGCDFIGQRIPKKRKVLLVQFEVQDSDVHRRLKLLQSGMGTPDVGERLAIFNARGHDFELSRFEWVVKELRPEVLILDPLYAMQEGGENAAEDMKPVFRQFLRIASENGCCVCYVHHDAKGNASSRSTRDRGSGSGVIGRAYDAAFLICEHEEEDHFVVETLLRSYPMKKPFAAVWQNGAFLPSSRPAIPKKPASPNANPFTTHPDSDFYPNVFAVLSASPGMKAGDLDEAVRAAAGVTRDKAAQIRLAAIRDGEIEVRNVFKSGKLHFLPGSNGKNGG